MINLYTPSQEITEFVLIGKAIQKNKRICLHEVVDEKIGAEIPFTLESAQKIFSMFSEYKYEHKVFEGLIPKDIIYAKDSKEKGVQLVWIVPKAKRKLFFSEDNKNDELISEEYNIPTLVFKYSRKSLSVYAVCDANANNITQDTELFQAPFYNVSEQGFVCMGNVNINKVSKFKTFDKCKEFLETSFFNSYFTHSNNEKIITPEYLLKIKNEKIFNTQNLFKTKLNLNSIL